MSVHVTPCVLCSAQIRMLCGAVDLASMSAPCVSPHSSLPQRPGSGFGLALRTIVSNLWLFGSVFTHTLASDPTTAPMVRTTTAVTVVSGGLADNVMPTTATALVNHRIHPLDTVESVVEHDRKVRVGG
jgi:carboxypeptidase PM20D1